jgi:hypothetical protein
MQRLRYDALGYIAKHGDVRSRLRTWGALGRANSREAQHALQELLALQREDGGWPWRMEKERPSSISDTGYTVEALIGAGLPPPHEACQRAAAFLLPLQHEDGGWPENPVLRNHIPWDWDWCSVDYSSPSTTAQALYIFHLAGREKDRVVKHGLRFIRRTQNADGGWPGHVGPTYPYGTDWASMFSILRALRVWGAHPRIQAIINRAVTAIRTHREAWTTTVDNPLDTFLLLGYGLGDPDVQEALELLIKAQRPDGGWNWFGDLPSSPNQTANWIIALAGAGFDLTPA